MASRPWYNQGRSGHGRGRANIIAQRGAVGVFVRRLAVEDVVDGVASQDMSLAMEVDPVGIGPRRRIGDPRHILHDGADVVVLHYVVPAADVDTDRTYMVDDVVLYRGIATQGRIG